MVETKAGVTGTTDVAGLRDAKMFYKIPQISAQSRGKKTKTKQKNGKASDFNKLYLLT